MLQPYIDAPVIFKEISSTLDHVSFGGSKMSNRISLRSYKSVLVPVSPSSFQHKLCRLFPFT